MHQLKGYVKIQSQEIAQSENLRAVIVYVIARLFLPVPDSAEDKKKAVHYLCLLKSNNIIGQKKITNKEKLFYSWLISFNLKLPCTQLILVNSKDLLYILCIYRINWLRVLSCPEKINRILVVIHHENIHELSSLRFLHLNLKWQNIKMRKKTYDLNFLHETMF